MAYISKQQLEENKPVHLSSIVTLWKRVVIEYVLTTSNTTGISWKTSWSNWDHPKFFWRSICAVFYFLFSVFWCCWVFLRYHGVVSFHSIIQFWMTVWYLTPTYFYWTSACLPLSWLYPYVKKYNLKHKISSIEQNTFRDFPYIL